MGLLETIIKYKFRDVIDECQFMDLGHVGPKFTWAKHYVDGHSIRIRLDRCMATNSWFQKFPRTRVHHLSCMSSDHSSLLINLSGLPDPGRRDVSDLKKCGYWT